MKEKYDVVVAGGGAAGVAAAIGAHKAGASVLLVERSGNFGGQAVNSCVASYCGFYTHGEKIRQIVKGVGQEVLEQLDAIGEYRGYRLSPTGNAIITFDEEALKYAFDRLIETYGFDVALHCSVTGVEKSAGGKTITAVRCTDDERTYRIAAGQFVDATGDGNLAYAAGLSYRFGDGKGFSYPTSRVMRIDRVPSDLQFPPAMLKEAILKAKADGYTHITKETGIIFRAASDTVYAILPSAEVRDLTSGTLTACELDTRLQSRTYLEIFRKYIPGMEECRLVSTGNRLGIRDSRHFETRAEVTSEEVRNGVKPEDTIAMGAWPCEMHRSLSAMIEYIYVNNDDCYGISLKALQAKETDNLMFAGRQIGADHEAFASVRVMGTGFATGHAAGVAAALKAKDNACSVREIQKELVRQNAHLEGINL